MRRPLENIRHERFCQSMAEGKKPVDAYIDAGYGAKPGASASGAAYRLSKLPHIEQRIEEIMRAAAALAEIKAADVVLELSRIAFFDPRKVVRWTDAQTEVYEANPDELPDEVVDALEQEVLAGKVERGLDGIYRRRVVISPGVWLVNSDEIGPDAAAAILAVEQTGTGVRIKFHSKISALEMLGKYLQMWKDDAATQGKPFAITDKPLSPEEWIKQFTDEGGETQH